jgi:hypothetical protein
MIYVHTKFLGNVCEVLKLGQVKLMRSQNQSELKMAKFHVTGLKTEAMWER